MKAQHVTLPIEDLRCGGALIVERALARTPGVLRVYVNAATEMAYIQYDADRCTINALREAVARAGFQAGVPVAV